MIHAHKKRACLRLRSRSGFLEKDLILTRFLDIYETALTDIEVDAFYYLLNLTDIDLINLLLARIESPAALTLPDYVYIFLRKIRHATQ